MIDANEIIGKQLTLDEKQTVELSDGTETVITPAKFVPRLDDEKRSLSLNGTWRVLRWPFKRDEAKLAAPETSDSNWQTVEQPGPVFMADPEENPAAVKNWNRVTLEHIDAEDGAVIRCAPVVPARWRGKRVFLHFDAIYPAARIYCNGQLLGEHLSGLTPVEYDVTGIVKPGKPATIAVRLLRKHEMVQLDMPRHAVEFTGLCQDAWLHAVEKCHIADYHLVSSVGKSLKQAEMSGTMRIDNSGLKPAKCSLTVTLVDPSGKRRKCRKQATLPAGGVKDVPVSIAVDKVVLWNDEYPNLYGVEAVLEVEGQDSQTLTWRTGFRRFELKNGRATLNGNPVKFRGVNHLTNHPKLGMYTPVEWLRECLALMKRANVNAIRTHFLGPRVLADLCDEMGIYLLQELPFDWGTHYGHKKEWMGPILMRLEGGIRRDRHHPSVMVWSVGNENMPFTQEVRDDFYNHLAICETLVKKLDASRPSMFPPPGPANKIEGIIETRFGEIADTHYSFKLIKKLNEEGKIVSPVTWDGEMREFTRKEAMASGWSGVWFSSEYGISNLLPEVLNAPYQSIIADVMEDPVSGKNTQQMFIDRLSREWGYMRDDPSCLGGAYFSWIAAASGEPWGWVRWGEDADWGIVTHDLMPKPFFWAMRVLFCPVLFPQRHRWQPGDTEIAFETTNHFNSIDLSECTLRTMMGGGPPYMSTMRAWEDVPVSCPPGQTTTIRIPIWSAHSLKTLEKGAPVICRCILLDPQGTRMTTADILVEPVKKEEVKVQMTIGPDAVLE